MALSFQDKIRPVSTTTQQSAVSFADKVRPVASTPTPSVIPQQEKQRGILGGIAMSTGVPRLTANIIRAGQATANVGRALVGADVKELDTAKPVRMPWLGDVKPVGQEGTIGERTRDITGESLKLTSTVLPVGGGLAKVGRATLAGRVGQGALVGVKSGVVGGGLYGVGEGIQQEDATAGSTLKSGAFGAGFGAVGGSVLGAAAPLLSKGFSSVYRRVTTPVQKRVQKEIIEQFEKGVKPNLPGKTTPTSRTKFNTQIAEGVEVINNNKAGLQFTDDAGEIITGKAPRTLKEFSDSIEQTKARVFSEYDNLASQAGEAGVKVDILPIANELDEVINNKALQLSHPEAVAYAQQVQKRFQTTGPIDAKTAQEVIKNYNNSLQTFYRNPTPEGLTRNAVDAMMVNRIRKALDDGIEGLTGAQYQVLKNQYGAIKAIERDVMRANLRDARRNIKGLIDFTDVFSGGQVVSGILSANPASVASGLTQKAIATYFKYINNPNRAVKNMFKIADKLDAKIPTIPVSTRKGLPAGPIRTPGEPGVRSSVGSGAVIPVAPSGTTKAFTDVRASRGGIPQSNQVPASTRLATKPIVSSATKVNNIPKSKPPVATKVKGVKEVSVAKRKIEEMKQAIAIEEEVLSNSDAKALMKYTGRGDNTLAEINVRAEGTKRASARLDDIVTEAGFKDLDDAQKGIDKYVKQRDALKVTKKELQRLRKETNSGEDVLTYDDPKYQNAEMFAGAPAGIEIDENGKMTFNTEKALAGMAVIAGVTKAKKLTNQQLISKVRTSTNALTKKEMEAFIDVVRLKKFKVGTDELLEFTDKASREDFYRGMAIVSDKPLMKNTVSNSTPQKIADFFDKVLDNKPIVAVKDKIDKYKNTRNKLKIGEILVKQKKTGDIGAISESDFNIGTYERV